MSSRALTRAFELFESVGAVPSDSPGLRLQKRVLVGISVLVAIAAMVWGAIYFAAGEPLAASIPWVYSATSLLSLVVFAVTKRYLFYRTSQLALILVLPFLLQLVLGGFVNASAVILWALLAPLGALLVAGRRAGIYTFGAYVLLVVLASVIQRSLDVSNELSTGMILLFFVMNIVGVSAITFVTLLYFAGQKDDALRLLGIERGKSDRLLLNVLPREVADVLREENRTIAEHCDDVSVLFADIVGFTSLSERLSPGELVELLNEIFSQFDALADRYGVEKIRTIGDAYMVAAGVPTPRADHAQVLTSLALDFNGLTASDTSGESLKLRVGINSGPVVAGVIGQAKFQYDIWGDTVNTASRMESHGMPGRIQITESTHELIKDAFHCTARGTIEVKGKGMMETWFVDRAR